MHVEIVEDVAKRPTLNGLLRDTQNLSEVLVYRVLRECCPELKLMQHSVQLRRAANEHFHAVRHCRGKADLSFGATHPRPRQGVKNTVEEHGDFVALEVVNVDGEQHQRAVRDDPLSAKCHVNSPVIGSGVPVLPG